MINLDAANDSELEQAYQVVKLLDRYIVLRFKAMKDRLEGRIEQAVEIEQKLDAIHRQLPGWATW